MNKEIKEYVNDKLDFIKDLLETLKSDLDYLRNKVDEITSTPVNELDNYIYGYRRDGNYVNGLYDNVSNGINDIDDIVKQVEKVEELIKDE